MKGKLFLLPTILAADTQHTTIPSSVTEAIKGIHYFLCENVRTARRYVSSLKIHDSMESLQFEVLDKDTRAEALAKLMEPIGGGKNIGVLSESGCPGVADPGALAVHFAHEHQIVVVPLVGPSSILLALMASGLNGQQFAFHGYLPIDSKEVAAAIKNLERESKERNQTQIFIETPHRNRPLMGHLIKSLRVDTQLCIAANLTSSEEKVLCKTVQRWKAESLALEKVPTVFLFLATS